jgi:hypothetical protein
MVYIRKLMNDLANGKLNIEIDTVMDEYLFYLPDEVQEYIRYCYFSRIREIKGPYYPIDSYELYAWVSSSDDDE